MSRMVWVRLLGVASIGLILFGLIALAASHPSGAAPWGFLFDLVRWSFEPGPYQFDKDAQLLNGISGGVLFGWGVVLTWLSFGPIAKGDESARRVAMIGAGSWFVADSLGSLLSGTPGNIILNLGFLLAFMGPLVMIGRSAVDGRVPNAG